MAFGRKRLNKFQAAVAARHGGGDYAHFIEEGLTVEDLDNCGDTLFKFMMIELEDEGATPMDLDTATQRMATAVCECQTAFNTLLSIRE